MHQYQPCGLWVSVCVGDGRRYFMDAVGGGGQVGEWHLEDTVFNRPAIKVTK